MVIASFLTTLSGVLVFLFIFWKRLREDYASEMIFKTALYILIGITIGVLVSLKFLPNAFLWLGLLGSILGLAFAILRLKLKFYETFEAFVISILPWMSFVFLSNSVTNSSLTSFLAFIGILILVFISYYLDLRYKSFTWYKSGRIGFAGLATSAIFFIVRATLAIFRINMLSFLNQSLEILFSICIALVCIGLIIKLANDKK